LNNNKKYINILLKLTIFIVNFNFNFNYKKIITLMMYLIDVFIKCIKLKGIDISTNKYK